MRKKIDRKIYDTKTANLIVSLPCIHPRYNGKWNETALYRNPMGRYFLAGHGGPLSRWAEKTPTGAIAGEGIEPISREDARDYAIYAGRSLNRFTCIELKLVEDY